MPFIDRVCPRCGSDDSASLQVVYENGASRSRGLLVAAIGDSLAFGSHGGVQVTQAAERAAPPAQKSVSSARVAMLVCPIGTVACTLGGLDHILGRPKDQDWFAASIMFGLAAVLLVGTFVAIASWHAARRYNASQWPTLFRRWSERWMCRRCGCVFTPGQMPVEIVQ